MRHAGGRWAWGALVAGLVVVAACGGGDDDDSGAKAKKDDDTKAASGVETAVDPYDGFRSDVHDGTTNWLCHPDLDQDECTDLSATEITADGKTKQADLKEADDPAIDCFYVYPTVSLDKTPNSDLKPDQQEKTTVGAQAAPFATTCRVFAPVYTQVTLGQIGTGARNSEAGAKAYESALDAWKVYISQYNQGRGVILIGHSQGSFVLNQLIQQEIDDQPELRFRLVSAILLGGSAQAPDGKLVGGDFQNIPACQKADEVGCVITYSSYPTASPPADGAIFAGARGDTRSLCTDPVALAGGNDLADSIVPVKAPLIGGGDLTKTAAGITTRYVVLPDMLKASCQRTGAYDFFGVGPASADDKRTVALEGLLDERLGDTWGLHLQDSSLAMGDLLEIAAQEAEAYTKG